jgi:hypothetical protein
MSISGAYMVAAAALNRDGKLDLAVNSNGGNTVNVLLGGGDGTFTQPVGSPVAVGKGPSSITVADFNGSGRLGFAAANLIDGSVSVFIQH